MNTRLAAVVLGGLTLGAGTSSSTVSAADCLQGDYIADGATLLPGAPDKDRIVVHAGKVQIGGCTAKRLRVRVTNGGTIVRAKWLGCGGSARRFYVSARISADCRTMRGKLVTSNPFTWRRFNATRCDSPSCPQRCTVNPDCPDELPHPGLLSSYCAKAPGECDSAGACRDTPQVCTSVYNPVCGCDGHTYGNRCEAAGGGVNVRYVGDCRCDAGTPCVDDGFCDMPAGSCSDDFGEGVCAHPPPSCSRLNRPVCGCDGMTYRNDCERVVARVQRAGDGPCTEP